MAKLLKLRRGSTSQHSSFTGAEGEVTVDTDKDVLVVHDGSAAGGHPLAAQDMDNVPAGSILGTQLENSGVTAGQYGSSSAIPIVTVDAQGLVTAASTTAIDSTTIANGTSNVAVANNGDITSTRSGTARLVVNNSGISVTGDAAIGSDLTVSGGDITINGPIPSLHFNDTNHESDYQMRNYNGTLQFLDVDQGGGTVFYQRETNGDTTVTGNLNVTNGADISGGSLTVTGGEGSSASLSLIADQGDDNGDGWIIQSEQDENDLTFKSNTSGSYVDKLKLKSNGQLEPQGAISTGADILVGGSAKLDFTGTADEKISLGGSNNPYIRFEEGTTDKAYIQWNSSGYLDIYNQETDEAIRIKSGNNGLVFLEGGNERTVWHSGNDGSGSGLDADSLDGIGSGGFIRANVSDEATGDITFSGGAYAVSINGGSDIRFANGSWTGNHNAKIQHHDNRLYISGGTSGIIFREDGTNRWEIDGGGNFQPASNNTYDIGSTSYRVRNIYTNDLHLSNEGHSNDVDGTWGNWTIQEGESDLFLKNNRSGKKYKFNLTEVS